MEKTFRVGFCRLDMNPEESVPIAGFGNDPQRWSTHIKEDICVTCVAITDQEDTTALLLSFDLAVAPNDIVPAYRKLISIQEGVDEERIHISGTHTHSGPTLGMKEEPAVQRYYEKVQKQVLAAAHNAMEDRKTAAIRIGSLEVPNMNFVKHYKMRHGQTGEVSFVGDQYGTSEGKYIVEHATQVDKTMHLVCFDRQEAGPVVICNWRAHPHFDCGQYTYILSSSYIGPFRQVFELTSGCNVLFLQGAGGNINSTSRMHDERRFTTARSYGAALAAAATECLDRCMMPAREGKIQSCHSIFYGDINHTMDHLVPQAQLISDHWEKTYDRVETGRMGQPYGISSPYHAQAILRNATLGKEDGRLEVAALSIGPDVSLVTFPGELFDTISAQLEAVSPYKTTLLMGYCDHHVGYLPSAAAYKYGSYETDITRFAPGTAEKLQAEYLQMLVKLKESE